MELASRLGVTQGTLSRALSGRLSESSPTFRRLCIESGITMHIVEAADLDPALISTLNALWDGTEEHAKAIAGLLEAVKHVSATGARR